MAKNTTKYLSAEDVCNLLFISRATLNNWIKLKKIIPITIDNKVYFQKKYIDKLLSQINSGKLSKLKSRRNKKMKSGNFIYYNYIEENEQINKVMQKIIAEYRAGFSVSEIKIILTHFAISLVLQKIEKESANYDNFLVIEFLEGNLDLGIYNKLINDLLEGVQFDNKTLENLNPIFEHDIPFVHGSDILGFIYISLICINKRKKSGAYFTPHSVVKKCIEHLEVEVDITNSKIFDIACGTGNFLINLPNEVDPKLIYGCDIDELSIKIARLNIAINYNLAEIDFLYNNFQIKNSLKLQCNYDYDIIISNPPWGSSFSASDKKIYQKKYASVSNTTIEAYDLFLEQALKLVRTGGRVLFVLPEAILNVATHKNIRKYLLKSSQIKWVNYLGETFDGVQCPSIILDLEKRTSASEPSAIGIKVANNNDSFVIKKFRNINENNINLKFCDFEYGIISKIKNLPNCKYLKGNAIFGLGIVTGDNKKFLKPIEKCVNLDEFEPIYRGNEIYKYYISNAKNMVKFDGSSFQQVAKIEMYRADEKLIYRFISDRLIFAYDNSRSLTLNSCNILIPQFDDLSIKYILAILNSSVADYFYSREFNSVKKLKSHLENLPIIVASDDEKKTIEKLVEEIINEVDNKIKLELFRQLDNLIFELYQLNLTEQQFIMQSLVDKNLFLW